MFGNFQIWDSGTGQLKLTLTGHIEQVRGMSSYLHQQNPLPVISGEELTGSRECAFCTLLSVTILIKVNVVYKQVLQ